MAGFGAMVLTLGAVSLLLFQPICDAAELSLPQAPAASQATAAGGGHGDACCATLAPAPLHPPTAAAERPSVAVPQPSLGVSIFRPEMLISGTVASLAPLPVPRYYARSARIQR